MGSSKLSLRRLSYNNKTPDMPNPGAVTPVSVRSMSSSLSDDHLSYIDYKLRQYQKEEDKKAATPKQPIRKIACKIKTKVTSVFKGKEKDDDKEVYLPAWNDDLPTMSELPAASRGAMDIQDEQEKRKVNFETRLAGLRKVFSESETQEPDNSSSDYATHGNHADADMLQGLLRDGPKMSKPEVVETRNIESSNARPVRPREFM